MAKQTTSTTQGNTGAARPRPATAGAGSRGGGDRGGGDLASRRAGTPSIFTFFQESRAELRKVTWPTREQTLNLTGAVIAMTVIISLFLGVIDYLLNALIRPLVGG